MKALPRYDSEIAVIGMGYVGIPLFIEIAKNIRPKRLVGFDKDAKRIEWLASSASMSEYGYDIELNSLGDRCNIELSSNPDCLADCKIFIVAVPTPISNANAPDLSMMNEAATCVAEIAGEDDDTKVMIFESTVFPGACRETIQSCNRLRTLNEGGNIVIGYSPERINPGDQSHTLRNTIKIVSGETDEVASWVQGFYNLIVSAGTFLAPSIEVAEAAKVLENTQRDINIALANEMALICSRLGIRTADVLEAAETKWNFMKIRPGLVGGHCIGVDPYYLAYKAEEVGIHPQLILAGRNINDNMAGWVARKVLKELSRRKDYVRNSKCLVMGVTFKEDCNDTRNSKAIELAKLLMEYGVNVTTTDPLAEQMDIEVDGLTVKGYKTVHVETYDAIVIAVSHRFYKDIESEEYTNMIHPQGFIFDVRGVTRDRAIANTIFL